MTDDLRMQKLEETILQTTIQKKPETVNKLIELVKEAYPASDNEILEAVDKLQSEGKLKLAKPNQQETLVEPGILAFLRTHWALWFWVTLALALATLIAVFGIPETAIPIVYIRYVLGTIFILWLPGYSFIKALFPENLPFAKGIANTLETSEKNIDTIERVALSIGMSLALVPMVGLLLNYTPCGIRLTPIVLSLLTLTVIFATAAIIRQYSMRTPKKV